MKETPLAAGQRGCMQACINRFTGYELFAEDEQPISVTGHEPGHGKKLPPFLQKKLEFF